MARPWNRRPYHLMGKGGLTRCELNAISVSIAEPTDKVASICRSCAMFAMTHHPAFVGASSPVARDPIIEGVGTPVRGIYVPTHSGDS